MVLMLCAAAAKSAGSSILGRKYSGQIFRYPSKKSTQIYEQRVIYNDQQVTSFLMEGETQMFFYLLQHEVGYLTFVVTPCSADVSWSLTYRSRNDTGKVELGGGPWGERLSENRGSKRMRHTHDSAKPGLYIIQATATKAQTGLQLFASSLHRSGYPGLDMAPTKLVVIPSRTPGQITIAWHPSPIDPHWLEYWVSVSRKCHWGTLCGASTHAKEAEVHPVGRETRLTLRSVAPDTVHFFDVFALHSASNMSFLYATGEARYHKPKPTPLRDLKPVTTDLQILDGRASFRYKVRERGDKLEWYIEVCGGGSLDAEVRLRKRVIVGPVRVRGLATLSLPTPPTYAARYVLRLTASDQEQLAHISRVEVMGSMRGVPVIQMPEDRSVHEFQGLKRCRSVTLGWRPAVDQTNLVYCMRATLTPPESDPCSLHDSLNSLDFASLQCHDLPYPHNLTIVTQELSNLKPGRTYYIQITVKSNKAKISAYDIIQVYTKSNC